MEEHTFNTVEEIINKSIADGACQEASMDIENIFKLEAESVDDLLSRIPHEYLFWCLLKGYVQVEEHLEWENLSTKQWINIMKRTNKYDNLCDLSIFDGEGLKILLRYRPDLSNSINWDLLSLEQKEYVYKYHPGLRFR